MMAAACLLLPFFPLPVNFSQTIDGIALKSNLRADSFGFFIQILGPETLADREVVLKIFVSLPQFPCNLSRQYSGHQIFSHSACCESF